uniref:(northern house mosquito) hypothetical protein n=1 Tax=Culex pipiens TaxID=7175 RepID=A0A8D8DIG8_CULPI
MASSQASRRSCPFSRPLIASNQRVLGLPVRLLLFTTGKLASMTTLFAGSLFHIPATCTAHRTCLAFTTHMIGLQMSGCFAPLNIALSSSSSNLTSMASLLASTVHVSHPSRTLDLICSSYFLHFLRISCSDFSIFS